MTNVREEMHATHGREEMHAELILRLLLSGPRGADGGGSKESAGDSFEGGRDSLKAEFGRVCWEELLRVAERNVVLVRLAARLEGLGIPSPAFFVAAVERARERSRAVVETIRRVGAACERRGVEYIFAKAFQHYPDVGRDVDLFVSARAAEVDALILEGMSAAPARRTLQSRMAGAASYRVAGCAAALDIHHGRLGLLGEHDSHIGLLVRNASRVRVEGAELLAPSAADLLVLQGMQRVYAHGYIRLCDVVSTASLLRGPALDWDYVVRTSERLGTTYGLRCYLNYVEQIHRGALGVGLLPAETRGVLARGRVGRVEFREGFYRFPRWEVAGRVHLGKVRAAVRAGNWEAASRLCLLPLVTAESALRKLSGLRAAEAPLTSLPRAASR